MVLALGSEWDLADARKALLELVLGQAIFLSRDDQRSLGWVALDHPAAFDLDQLGIVGQRASAQSLLDIGARLCRQPVQRSAGDTQVADRGVAATADIDHHAG